MTPTRPAMRYHGGKWRLAPWLLERMPAHTCYVEPFGGAAGVLLQKPRSYAEVYNDLDGDIVNFFRVVQNPENCARLVEVCTLTPYAREEFELAWEETTDPVERARRVVIRAEMGFGSAGATKGHTGFRIDTKREYGTSQHAWVRYPANIAVVGRRMMGVVIENRPAISVIEAHDASETLFLVDPPYVFNTRSLDAGKRGYYRHEMTDDDHLRLIETLKCVKGMVMLCGYPSDLYESQLEGWTREQTTSRASAARGTGMRTEVLWMNAACAAARSGQQRLVA